VWNGNDVVQVLNGFVEQVWNGNDVVQVLNGNDVVQGLTETVLEENDVVQVLKEIAGQLWDGNGLVQVRTETVEMVWSGTVVGQVWNGSEGRDC
jgi:nucleoside diphosphate kinase